MRFQRIWIGRSILLLTVCSVVAVPVVPVVSVIWHHLHILYPTPDTESAFLKNYSPQHVIEPFECNLPSSRLGGKGGSAGYKFVTHNAEFRWFFVMRSDGWMPLMEALDDDASTQLLSNGAQILSRSGDPRSGFYFDYRLGKSVGTVTIFPLATTPPDSVHRGGPLPKGTVDVTVRIEVAEEWFPKEPGTFQVRINDSTNH